MQFSTNSSNLWSNVFDIETKTKRVGELEKEVASEGFWQSKNAGQKQQELAELKQQIKDIASLRKETEDLLELSDIIQDEEEAQDLLNKLNKLESRIKLINRQLLLSGKYDRGNAIISVKAGAGGRDAEDWATMLWRMYQKYCENKGWEYKVLSESFGEAGGPEGRIGLKEASMQIKGRYAYGLLKKEKGAHRLVRLSPFSSKQLRHTSFAKIEVLPKLAPTDLTAIKLNPDDLKIETCKSSGHGGQNVNKRETAIRITHLPTGLSASSQAERQQARNRDIAMQVLQSKIAAREEEKLSQELKAAKGKNVEADFGHQIRSYVLHPYQLVKDLRTHVESAHIEEILEGNLDKFIEAEIQNSQLC